MIIKNLKLRNFKRYRELELTDIPDGIIAIIGPNGSGKSTILEAFAWALYGTHALGVDKDMVRTAGYETEKTEVIVEFKFRDQDFRVERSLSGKNSYAQAAVYKGGQDKPVAEKEEGVNSYITKLLEMDRKSFMISVFARQKEIDSFFRERPGERKKIVENLLRLGVVRDAGDRVRTDKREKDKQVEISKSLQVDVGQLDKDLKLNKKEKNKLQEAEKGIAEEQENKEKDVEGLSSSVKEQEKLQKEFNRLQNIETKKKTELESDNKSIQKNIKTIEKLEEKEKLLKGMGDVEKEYAKARSGLEKYDEQKNKDKRKRDLEKDIAKKSGDIGDLEDELKKAEKDSGKYKNINKEIGNCKKQFDECSGVIKSIQHEISSARGMVKNLKKGEKEIKEKMDELAELGPDSKCPQCLRVLGDSYEDAQKHFKDEIKKIKEEIKGQNKKIEENEEALKKKESERKVLEGKMEKLSAGEKEYVSLDTAKTQMEKRIKDMAGDLESKKTEIKQLGKVSYDESEHKALKEKEKELRNDTLTARAMKAEVKQIVTLQQENKRLGEEVETLKKEKEKLLAEIKSLGFDEKKFDELKERYEGKRKELDAVKQKRNKIKSDIRVINERVKNIKQKIEEQKGFREKIKGLQEEIRIMGLLDELLKEFAAFISSRIRPLIQERTGRLVEMTTRDKYSRINLDENYTILMEDREKMFPLERFSGGEQDLVNLCLRIAISRVLSDRSGAEINFIVLDEIFGSQDDERRRSILNSLNTLSGQFCQIFLVTHVSELKDMFQFVINVSEDESGNSTAVFLP